MAQREFPCGQCGAKLQFEPGTTQLVCPYCGHTTAITVADEPVNEQDYTAYLAELDGHDAEDDRTVVKCTACAAESTLPANITADRCPFCGSPIVAESVTRRLIKPGGLLPFLITLAEARAAFRAWISSRWFAPNALKKFAEAANKLDGIYIPYWTYDSDTTSRYTGQRGDDYTETEYYTDSEGKRQSRTVTRTRWTSVRGTVNDQFNDVLVLASNSLPRKYTEALEPWDLPNVVPYNDDFLSGFRAESYQIGLKDGFDLAREIMAVTIRQTICSDIGGDHQRIDSVNTRYDNITFKHLLLPIWLSAYRFRDRTFRFLVNARTGEVQGERPYSWVKITMAILLGAALVAAIVLAVQYNQRGHSVRPPQPVPQHTTSVRY